MGIFRKSKSKENIKVGYGPKDIASRERLDQSVIDDIHRRMDDLWNKCESKKEGIFTNAMVKGVIEDP